MLPQFSESRATHVIAKFPQRLEVNVFQRTILHNITIKRILSHETNISISAHSGNLLLRATNISLMSSHVAHFLILIQMHRLQIRLSNGDIHSDDLFAGDFYDRNTPRLRA